MKNTALRKGARRIRRLLYALLDRDVFIETTVHVDVEQHGSEYGGWVVLADSLSQESLVISAGLGHDITFDESIIAKYGCKVIGYDPDPKAYAYHDKASFPALFEWRRYGLSDKSGRMKLYMPHRDDWISGTLVPGAIRHSEDYCFVEILDVVEVLNSFQGDIDVLKMDIEGAEYDVVDRLIASGHISRIRQLLIEFHHGNKYRGSDTKHRVENILEEGFELFFVSDVGHEYSFCRKHS